MKNGVLVVTSASDLSVDGVIYMLQSQGERVYRFNTDEFPSATILTLNLQEAVFAGHIQTNDGSVVIELADVKSCWYRGVIGSRSTFDGDEGYRRFAEEEANAALWAFYTCLDSFWVNPPMFGSRVIGNNKSYQMFTASRAGLRCPKTIITNNPEELLDFCNQCGGIIAVKTLSGRMLVSSGTTEVFGIYTRKVSKANLYSNYENLRLAPVFAQEYIQKKIELRITIVGQQVFACAIHSQDSEKTREDWRHYDFKNVKHEPYQLPAEIQGKLLRLMALWNLQFGAIDMILTPDGEYIFLEVNPQGQWGWIENLTGLPITKAITELLVNPPIS